MPHPKSPVRLDALDPTVCSLDYRLKIIGRLPFFKHLPADAISGINRLFQDRDVSAGQRIYFEGDEAERLYLVATGKVRLARTPVSGREVLLDILQGGEYFGALKIFGEQTYAETAIAQTDCCILNISSADFETILNEHPDVTRKMLAAVNQRLTEARELIQQLSAHTVERRVAFTLLRLAGKLGETHGANVLIQLPFSRQDLAAMTGATPETVSRVMSHFAAQGLIQSGRKWVAVMDLPRLKEVAKQGAVN